MVIEARPVLLARLVGRRRCVGGEEVKADECVWCRVVSIEYSGDQMETSELGARYCHICTPAPPIHNMLTGFLQFSGSLDLQYCCTAAGPVIIVIAICAIEALRDWSQHSSPLPQSDTLFLCDSKLSATVAALV